MPDNLNPLDDMAEGYNNGQGDSDLMPEDMPQQQDDQPNERNAKDKVDDIQDKIEKGRDKYKKYKEGKEKPEGAPEGGEGSPAKPNANQGLKEGSSDAAKQGSKGLEKDAAKDAVSGGTKQAGKEVGKEAGKDVAKQVGKQAAKEGAKAGAKVAAEAATSETVIIPIAIEVVDRIGTFAAKNKQSLRICAGTCLFSFILVFLIGAGLLAYSWDGGFGMKPPLPSGKDSTQVKNLLQEADKPVENKLYNKALSNLGSGPSGFKHLDLKERDKKFVQDGLIDKRLADALQYLLDRHIYIKVSHIISDFEEMPYNPEDKTDQQLVSNVSAHKKGLAADVSEIDFVYKVLEPGGCTASGRFDIVYYNDAGNKPDRSVLKEQTSADTNVGGQNIDLETIKLDTGTALDSINVNTTELKTALKNICQENDQVKSAIEELENFRLPSELKQNLNTNLDIANQAQTKLGELNTIAKTDEEIAKIASLEKEYADKLVYAQKTNDFFGNISEDLDDAYGQIAAWQNIPCDQIDAKKLADAINLINNGLTALKNLDNYPELKNLEKITEVISEIDSTLETALKENFDTAKLDEVLGQLDGQIGSVAGISGLGGGNQQLLRLFCEGTIASINKNTTWNGFPAEGIPIKVSWQDPKPNNAHVDSIGVDGSGIDPRVFYGVYRPEARRKVHQVLADLLQFPYDMKDSYYYRITQLITFNKERDVDPFQESGILDKLYGFPRPKNQGLFAMEESWAQIHIAY